MSHVLVTCAGRRVSLVRSFIEAAHERGLKVVAADPDPLAPALIDVDDAVRVPPLTDPDYVPALLEVVREHGIGLVVPTIDTELPVLARHRAEFTDAGATALVSSAGFIDTCGDKSLTGHAFSMHGVDVPRSWLPRDLADGVPREVPEALVVKPRNGSSSKDVHLIGRDQVLQTVAVVPQPIVQERLTGPEVTVDALLDLEGLTTALRPAHAAEDIGRRVHPRCHAAARRAGPMDRARPLCLQHPRGPRSGDLAVLPHRPWPGPHRGQSTVRRRIPPDESGRWRLPRLAARRARRRHHRGAVRRLPGGALHDPLHGGALHRHAAMVRSDLRGVVLDLDDTLYLERDYVRSGFGAVAEHLASQWDVDAEHVREHLWQRFTGGERGNHFDELVAGDPSLRDRVHVPDLVEVYRHHVPDIQLLPGMEALLGKLRASGLRTGVISDGALASQQAKVGALGIDRLVDGPVVLTDVWGREGWKPHPRAFLHVQEAWGLAAERLVYVGDNPHKDFDAPHALGWACVRLRLPGQLHSNAEDRVVPDLTVTSVAALVGALTPGPRLR